ncbi:MAG: PEP-utilizing enzyme, partial [Gemmataceae bacterium]
LFRRIDRAIGSARSLPELHAATVVALRLALRGNSAINSLLAGALKVRQLLRIPGTARVVTRAMMDDYRRLAGLPPEKQAAGLDEWLKLYGHRGPLESDPVRPRFAELRDVLLRDLASTPPGAAPPETAGVGRLFRPLFWIDERREWFRDQLMHRWQGLRQLILEEARRLVAAGELNAPEDAFWLRGEELADGRDMRQAVAAAKERRRAVEGVELPLTVPQEEIQALLTRAELARAPTDDRRLFPGIGLTSAVVEGIVRKADDLMQLLTTGGFDPETILVVPTLEPSWAVVFPRVGGVVADVGGELSHASILLREARRPAVVNCTGIFKQVRDGERIRLDGVRGVVERLQ